MCACLFVIRYTVRGANLYNSRRFGFFCYTAQAVDIRFGHVKIPTSRRFTIMENIFIFKFIIALNFICLQHETRSYGGGGGDALPVELVNHVNYVCSDEHWNMMRFVAVHCESGWVSKDDIIGKTSGLSALDKLKTLPYMMGCGYGNILYHFLWLMLHTGEECKSITPKFVADDCWTKLKASVKNGEVTVLKLLRTFELVHSYDESIVPSPYYELLMSIRSFLETYGSSPGSDAGVGQSTDLATSLGTVLDMNCKPKRRISHVEIIDKLTAEYPKKDVICNRYDLYVKRLDWYMAYIGNHFLHLGFHYNVVTDKIAFTTPSD